PQRFSPVFFDQNKRIDDVPYALTHFCATEVPPTVDEQLRHLILWESDRMQHDEPVDAVRWYENVFADDLQRVLRPTVAEFLRLRVEFTCSHGPMGRPERLAACIGLDRPQAGGYSARVWIIACETDVVGQCVKPNVSHKIFVERQLDSPVEP